MTQETKKYPLVSSVLVVASVVFVAYRVIVGMGLVLDRYTGDGIQQIVEGFFIASLGLAVAYIAMRVAPTKKADVESRPPKENRPQVSRPDRSIPPRQG